MYCPKCGRKALDDATFCQNCGAKLSTAVDDAQSGKTPNENPMQRSNNTPAGTPKKKRKLPIIIGVAAVLSLILVILAAIGGGGDSKTSPVDVNGVNLSQNYENAEEGFSFKYPSAYVPMRAEIIAELYDDDETAPLVALANEIDDLPEENTFISVSKFPATQDMIDHLFIDDEQFADTFDDDVTVKDTSITEIDGVSAREITYLTSDGFGRQSYFYAVGPSIYRIDFDWMGESSGNNQRFFDAIIGSYKIKNDPAGSGEPAADYTDPTATTGLCYRGVLVDDLLGISYDGFVGIFGEPDSSLFNGEENTYGNVTVYFDLFSQGTPYLCDISSPDLSDFTYDGQPITDNYDELTQLMGREPDSYASDGDTEEIVYIWDHMGSQAFLTINVSLTDADSTVSVSWWGDTTGSDPDVGTEFAANGLPDGFAWVEEPTGKTDQYGATVSGIVQNTSQKTYSYVDIRFKLYDSSGNQIGSALDTISDLRAGNTWKFEAFGAVSNATRFEFSSIDGR